MRASDRNQFAEVVTQAMVVYSASVTKAMLDTWWAVLEPYSIEAVKAAFTYHLGDHTGYGYRAPLPVDIKRHLDVTLPSLLRERISNMIAAARDQAAPLREQLSMHRNDVRLGIKEPSNGYVRHLESQIEQIMDSPEIREAQRRLELLEAMDRPSERMSRMPGVVRKAIGFITGRDA